MSDYLDRLVSRARGMAPALRPRLPSLFERVPGEPDVALDAAPPSELTDARSPQGSFAETIRSPRGAAPIPPVQPRPSVAARSPAPEVRTAPARESPALPETPPLARQPDADTPASAPAAAPASRVGAEATPAPAPRRRAVTPAVSPPPAPRRPAVTPPVPPAPQRAFPPAVVVDTPARADAPAIRVTIGRVEVRGAPPAREVRPARGAAAPRLTLDAYLRQRDEGKR